MSVCQVVVAIGIALSVITAACFVLGLLVIISAIGEDIHDEF
jgi:hypothetical protein|tara:strand:+ start:1132 stop:1257 length:126 start_codon:yes stop_codon:yes gene_type:complete